MVELFGRQLADLPRARLARTRFLIRSLLDVVLQGIAERARPYRQMRSASRRLGVTERVALQFQDFRYAFRSLRRSQWLSVTAVVALALGTGLTTLMFSIVYGVLWRGLPFGESAELVEVRRVTPAGTMLIDIADYEQWHERQRSFEDLGAYRQRAFDVAGEGLTPVHLQGAYMTASAFSVLGMAPAQGRVFTADDERPESPLVALIGWGVWQVDFGGDPAIVGRRIRVDARDAVIVGVMPRQFGFPETQRLWVPLRERSTGAGDEAVAVLGRLREGVTLEQARLELTELRRRLTPQASDQPAAGSLQLHLMTSRSVGPEGRTILYSAFGAVLLVLLVVCANIANLLIGRMTVRAREAAVRAALGASRLRVISQFLTESIVLGMAGVLPGAVIALIGVRWFNNVIMTAEPPPYWIDIRVDAAALLWAAMSALLASAAAGVMPALQVLRANTSDVLKDASRNATTFRLGRLPRVLVTAEIALSLALLVAAGLTIKSIVQLNSVNLGFDARRVLAARLNLPDRSPPDERIRFAVDAVARVHGVAGLVAATAASSAPGLSTSQTAVLADSRAAANDFITMPVVSIMPGFFDALRVRLSSGRPFTNLDRAGTPPVAIVNRSFEQRFHPGSSALGRRLRFGGSDSTAGWLTIVGVVPDMYANGVAEGQSAAVYRPMAQAPTRSLVLLAATRGDALSVLPGVRSAIAALDPDLPLVETGSLLHLVRLQNWAYGTFGSLFISFGISALFIATIGLYGLMAFSVTQRRRELGVRRALGATSHQIMRIILNQGVRHVAPGIAIGLVLAFAASHVLDFLLFGVQPRDPMIFLATTAVLLLTAILACWIPARRAAGADLLEVLRSD
jgi:predicted permease